MPLLAEYALTPDVFDSTSYSSDEVCGIRLQGLKEVLLSEGLVRDLRDRQWSGLFATDGRSWHNRGKELLKKLAIQKRLCQCPCVSPDEPNSDVAWCQEALASHNGTPLNGIIATGPVAQQFRNEPLVGAVERLSVAPWWAARSPSVRLNRTITDYIENLRLILSHANSLQFIDPHLDPRQRRYHDFLTILQEIPMRRPRPQIEVHRRCYFENRDQRNQFDEAGWRRLFDSWSGHLRQEGLSVEVFIWDDFHDRHLISNLVGVHLGNGFDTTTNPRSVTTWTRLGRREAEDIDREFNPATNRHTLYHRFRIPR